MAVVRPGDAATARDVVGRIRRVMASPSAIRGAGLRRVALERRLGRGRAVRETASVAETTRRRSSWSTMLRRTSRRSRVATVTLTARGGAAPPAFSRGAERDRFLGVVADEDRFDHEVRLKRRCDRLEEEQLLDGP